jgi:AcrR family transcriptional regulator
MSKKLDKSLTMRRLPRQARSLERVKQILDAAEVLFIQDGFNGTTTNAIATLAKVPIGSLYQFFPDKSAIVYALAERYNDQLRELLKKIYEQLSNQTLEDYAEQIVDEVYSYFKQKPGLYAIFMPLQGALPELVQIEESADNDLIEDLAVFLSNQHLNLRYDDYKRIGFILVKAIGNLLWLLLGRSDDEQIQLVREVKRLCVSYLQSYILE